MKFITILLSLIMTSCVTNQRNKYLNFLSENREHLGKKENNEIQIITEEAQIRKIEKAQKIRFMEKGLSEEQAFKDSKVGIVAEDYYWIWVRDAVETKNGMSTFDRLILRSSLSGSAGVAVLPIGEDKRFYLNCIFRHATRSWEIELPRGMHHHKNQLIETTAIERVQNETGLKVEKLHFLGHIAADSGTVNAIDFVYIANVKQHSKPHLEASEAIQGTIAFAENELKQAIIDGYYELNENGIRKKINVRDSFLTYAFLQFLLRKGTVDY